MKRVPVQACPDGTDRAEFSYFKNANTVQVKNGSTAITDAMSLNSKSAGDVVRCASIVTAQEIINASGTITISTTKAGGDCTATIYITVVRVA